MQLGLKESLLMIRKILGLFVNPLTADHKYYLFNRGNFFQHFQMQLYQKPKIVSEFFFAFSKFTFDFEHFQKEDDSHKWCSFELTDSEKRG